MNNEVLGLYFYFCMFVFSVNKSVMHVYSHTEEKKHLQNHMGICLLIMTVAIGGNSTLT